MDKRYFRSICFTLTACLMAGLIGCVKETVSEPPRSADEAKVRVMIGVEGRGSLFGADQFSDAAIKTIDVLAFDETDKTFLYHARAISIDPNYTYFDAILRRRAHNATQVFMVLANLSDEVSALLPSLQEEVITTISHVQQRLLFNFVHDNTPAGSTPDAQTFGKGRFLPMWGMSAAFALKLDGQTITAPAGLAIPLLRSVATVSVALDLPGGHAPFKLKQVVIYNTPNKGHAIPHEDHYSKNVVGDPGELIVRAFHPTTVTGATYDKAYFNCDNNINILGQIYIGEKYNGPHYLPGNDTTVPDDELSWIIIKGEYGNTNKDTWYKLPFHSKSGDLLNVVRNHNYMVNITSVSGPGEEKEEDLQGASPQITMEVKDWNMGGKFEVDANGYTLYVGQRKYYAPDWQAVTTPVEIDIETTYPTGWKAVLSGHDDKVADTPGWITLTNDQGTDDGDKLKFTLTDNTASAQRVGYIHVVCGRMSVVIEVTQGGLTFSVAPSSVTIAALGGDTETQSVSVNTNYTGWTFTKSESVDEVKGAGWLTVTKTASGLTFEAEENLNLTSGRTAYVKVIAGEQYAWVTVTQEKYGEYTIKNLNPDEIPQTGGYIPLKIDGEYWPDFRVRVIHKDNGTVIVQPQVVLSSKTPYHPGTATLTVPPNETWEPIPLLVQYLTDGTDWMPIHEGSETRQVSHTNDTPSLPATSIWRNGETITVTIPGNYPDGYIQVRATGTGFNEISGHTNASKQVALAIPHNATGTKASDSRTVTFQYRRFVNNAWETTWRPIKDIPQIKGNVILNGTGRMVAIADYDNGQLLTWAEAMGLDDRYNYTNFGPWLDPRETDMTKLDIRYYTPTQSTGCAAYSEPDAPAGSWRLPIKPEFDEMMCEKFDELEGLRDPDWVGISANTRYWVSREGFYYQDEMACTVAFRPSVSNPGEIYTWPDVDKFRNPQGDQGARRMYVRCVRDK